MRYYGVDISTEVREAIKLAGFRYCRVTFVERQHGSGSMEYQGAIWKDGPWFTLDHSLFTRTA